MDISSSNITIVIRMRGESGDGQLDRRVQKLADAGVECLAAVVFDYPVGEIVVACVDGANDPLRVAALFRDDSDVETFPGAQFLAVCAQRRELMGDGAVAHASDVPADPLWLGIARGAGAAHRVRMICMVLERAGLSPVMMTFTRPVVVVGRCARLPPNRGCPRLV